MGAIVIVMLAGIIVLVVLDDVEGPLICEVNILPVPPAPEDRISVTIYAINPSGVSRAQLSWSINGEEWASKDISFFDGQCIAGGRWVGDFGPVQEGDSLDFYATAYDSSAFTNPTDTRTFSFEISP